MSCIVFGSPRILTKCRNGSLSPRSFVTNLLRSLINLYRAANLADSSPASAPLSLRVEPKPKSGIRQQDLLKKVVEIKPKRPKLSVSSDSSQPSTANTETALLNHKGEEAKRKEVGSELSSNVQAPTKADDTSKSLLGLAYESSDSEE